MGLHDSEEGHWETALGEETKPKKNLERQEAL